MQDSEGEAQSEIKGQSLVSERPMMMIAAVQRERECKGERVREKEKGRLTRLTASRLATQLRTERQVLKHCNLDSLLAIVKTLAQSVEGLTALKSLSVEARRQPLRHLQLITFHLLVFVHFLKPCKTFEVWRRQLDPTEILISDL